MSPLSMAALEQALASVDTAARLLPARIVRRVIKQHRQLTGLGVRIPHEECYVIPKAALQLIVEADELGPDLGNQLMDPTIILARPDDESLLLLPPEKLLRRYWQRLFHARIHFAYQALMEAGVYPVERVWANWQRLGQVLQEEARLALKDEDRLLPSEDERELYVEFSATYWELRYFQPELTPIVFPGIRDFEFVDSVLQEDLNVGYWFEATRLPGAAAPEPAALSKLALFPPGVFPGPLATLTEATFHGSHAVTAGTVAAHRPQPGEASATAAAAPATASPAATTAPSAPGGQYPWETLPLSEEAGDSSESFLQNLEIAGRKTLRARRKAHRARSKGNLVRSAILRAKAANKLTAAGQAHLLRAARNDLARLVERLRTALNFSEEDAQEWVKLLPTLLWPAARGIWTQEARFLYDLQKVCIDHERMVFKLDLIPWVLSFGRTPIRRPLPSQREVLMSKHLQSASSRVGLMEVPAQVRLQLSELLAGAAKLAEEHLRERIRPKVHGVLDRVDLRPHNVPERVACHKLVEELLDNIVDRGYLNIGLLRDAISRNALKLPDVSSIGEFVVGDRLLRADQELAQSLDGVYYRGAIYLRWPQRISSLAFGTRLGRWLTKMLLLPFGGAYLVLAGLDHTFLPLIRWAWPSLREFHLVSWPSVLGVGLFFSAVINSAQFRQGTWRILRMLGRGLKELFVDLPRAVMKLPAIRWLLQSPLWAGLQRYLIKPGLLSALIIALVRMPWRPGFQVGWFEVSVFPVANLLLNSRLGRNLDEVVTDWLVRSWNHFRLRVVMAVFQWIVDAFVRLTEVIERLMYAVDEWLRFRTGETLLSFWTKAILGVVWFWVSYIARIYFTLLIEPQVNPIKHFPVVTVSHKIILPLTPELTRLLASPLTPINTALAYTIATPTVFLLPGVFGFLAWELKENWRLYAANRALRLHPVAIGHHGETLQRMLRPGFHSGTIPKRYARLRRAAHKALSTGQWKLVRKHLKHLVRAEEDIRRFVEREFIQLLVEAQDSRARLPVCGEIQLGSTAVRIELKLPDEDSPPLWLEFAELHGWLTARYLQRGWLDTLAPRESDLTEAALIGLFHAAGVHLLHADIAALLGDPNARYELLESGIKAWPHDRPQSHQLLAFQKEEVSGPPAKGLSTASGALSPQHSVANAQTTRMSEILTADLNAPPDQATAFFSKRFITWRNWVRFWSSRLWASGASASGSPARVFERPDSLGSPSAPSATGNAGSHGAAAERPADEARSPDSPDDTRLYTP